MVDTHKANGLGLGSEPPETRSVDRRRLIPKTGLKEYWYPAIQEKRVKKKQPHRLQILGEHLVLFRSASGEVVALWDVCPHRGGSLGSGDSHFSGTVSCPYHGWTFDGEGHCVAVLTEGPDSFIPGKVTARKYPTHTLKGIVFVWMGEGEPAPIEEDVPEELFESDSESMVFVFTQYWDVNWAIALENSLDSHVPYVHRNSWLASVQFMQHYGPRGRRPIMVRNGVSAVATESQRRPEQEWYPGLGKWPKSRWRRLWTWVIRPAAKRASRGSRFNRSDEWGMAHHLPSQFRTLSSTHAYTRVCVPVDEGRTRVIYYYSTRPRNWLHRAYIWTHYHVFYKWHMLVHFSNQDLYPMRLQRWDTAEMLSPNDAELIVWRKLLTQARGMNRFGVPEESSGERFAHDAEVSLGMDSTASLAEVGERK